MASAGASAAGGSAIGSCAATGSAWTVVRVASRPVRRAALRTTPAVPIGLCSLRMRGMPVGLHISLARPDVVGVLDRNDEDAAVSDLARTGRRDHRGYHFFGQVVGDDDLDFDFGQERDVVLLAAVDRRVAFLAA